MSDASRDLHDRTVAALEERADRLAPAYARVTAVMRAMFAVGAALMVLGIVLAAVKREPLDAAVDPLSQVIPQLLAGSASAVIDLAILWLMAAPVVATVVVFAGFVRIGDRRYAAVTALVLAVLAVSILRALR